MRSTHLLVLLPALVGVALGVYAYFTSETGVEGTGGALLALIGAVAVSLGALFAMRGRGRGLVLNILIGLGAALTAIAAWFLMQYFFAAAMALAFLGLLVALVRPARRMA